MDQAKLQKIKNIGTEVKDFHPLLRVLFKRLPEVKEVEYRQGPNEMGADFVIKKYDSTLGTEEYVGVIVKVGSIKQDHSEIDRQIQECSIERLFGSSKRKIFINQIWVICNEKITHNAEIKIHQRYSNQNIKFIAGEKVVSLIDQFYPEYWKDVTIELGEYFRKIRLTSVGLSRKIINTAGSDDDCYVEQFLIDQTVSKNPFKKKRLTKKEKIENILNKEDLIFVEAVMGGGKSTLIQHLIDKYSDSESYNLTKILPVVVTAKDFIENYSCNVNKAVSEVVLNNNLEQPDSVLFLIDAFDEVKISNDEKVEYLKTIYDTRCEKQKVLITSRDHESSDVSGCINKYYARYDLCGFSIKQVLSLVNKICNDQDINNRLVKHLEKTHLFNVLPKTPISAILLAKLLKENVQEIPSTMTDLYGKYMELILGRWDMEKGLQSQVEYDIVNSIIVKISAFYIDNSLSEIPIGDVQSVLEEYVDKRNLKVNVNDALNKLLEKQEIISYNSEKKTIRFRHRTFAEYFYALNMHNENSAVIDEEIYDPYWSTSYFFYMGVKRDCPELVKAINDIEFNDELNKFLKLFNNGNFLLAAYLTPYEIIHESVCKAFEDAVDVYHAILDGSADKLSLNLTHIQVLYLITMCMQNNYGFEFFQRSLEELAYNVAANSDLLNNEKEMTKLYLINNALMTATGKPTFDTMIKSYGRHIPLILQIGITQQTAVNEIESAESKKFIKKHIKNLKTNKSYKDKYTSLWSDVVNGQK